MRSLTYLIGISPGKGTIVIYYRTKDGEQDYSFSFERHPEGIWRAYIVSQPDYQGRSESLEDSHRLKNGDRYYVCWTPEPTSKEAAKQIAALWADRTQRYIKTGKAIHDP